MTTILMPMCIVCAHYNDDITCEAFPDGIPKEIFWQHIDHRKPFKGDNGITFEISDKYKDSEEEINREYDEVML